MSTPEHAGADRSGEGDLLEGDPSLLKRHVEGADDGQAEAARFLRAWRRVVDEDLVPLARGQGALWERIQADRAPKKAASPEGEGGPDDEGARVEAGEGLEIRRLGAERSPATCAFCHGYLSRRGRVRCRSCGAPHHLGCFRAHGRCSTMGCGQTRFERPVEAEADEPLQRGPWRLSLMIRTLAAAASLLIVLSAGALTWNAGAEDIDAEQRGHALTTLDTGLSNVSGGFANVAASALRDEESLAAARKLALDRALLEVVQRREVLAAAVVYQQPDGRTFFLAARLGQGAPAQLAYVRRTPPGPYLLSTGEAATADVGLLKSDSGGLDPCTVLRVGAPLREQVLSEPGVELWVFFDRTPTLQAKERTFQLVAVLTLAACCLVLGAFSWWCVRQRARLGRSTARS
ncbi:MAG: hypothetical protein AB7N76_24110 [Planctomycetota bacterium]